MEQFFNYIMNAAEDYSGKWAKKKGVDDNALSEWIKAMQNLVMRRVYIFT